MLVVTSDGDFHVISNEAELVHWRSSLGQLGIIVAVEMKLQSESLAKIIGMNPTDGQPILDPIKGGLQMSRDTIPFVQPADVVTTVQMIQNVTTQVYTTLERYDSVQFFFNAFTTSLSEYRTDFSGPRFSENDGNFPNTTLTEHYRIATEANPIKYQDSSFAGGAMIELSAQSICSFVCVYPVVRGRMNRAIQFHPNSKLWCEVPLSKPTRR